MKYPNKRQISEFLKTVDEDDFSTLIPKDASNVDKVKFQLCKKFVTYLQEKDMTQAELARRLHIDRSRVNWIVKYKIEHFSIDRLYELISLLDINVQLRVS